MAYLCFFNGRNFATSRSEKFQTTMPAGEQVNVAKQYSINSSLNVFTLGAVFEVTYKNFKKHIVNQLTHTRPVDATIGVGNYLSSPAFIQIYPNPTTEYFQVSSTESNTSLSFDYVIYNNVGIMVMHDQKAMWNHPTDISELKPGIYGLLINGDSQTTRFYGKICNFLRDLKYLCLNRTSFIK